MGPSRCSSTAGDNSDAPPRDDSHVSGRPNPSRVGSRLLECVVTLRAGTRDRPRSHSALFSPFVSWLTVDSGGAAAAARHRRSRDDRRRPPARSKAASTTEAAWSIEPPDLKGTSAVALIGVSVGLSSIAEIQIDGGLYNHLSITARDPGAPLSGHGRPPTAIRPRASRTSSSA